MRLSVYLPLLISGMVALLIRPLCGRLTPRRAASTLALASLLAALASTWGLLLLAVTLLESAGPVVEQASLRGMALRDPVPRPLAIGCAVVLVVLLARATRVFVAQRRALRHLRALCEECGRGLGELVVVPVQELDAVAVPGRPGRIVVTQGMLQVLDAGGRRVLLAHERAHLRQRHNVIQATAEFASALNPVFSVPLSSLGFIMERAADEQAAAVVGSRLVTAQAICDAGRATDSASASVARFRRPALDRSAAHRVTAMLQPAPQGRRLGGAFIALLAMAALIPAVDATLSLTHVADALWSF